MAVTIGIPGIGSVLRGDFGSGLVAVLEVANITGPSIAADVIDATHHGSPNRFREFLTGLIDPGEVTFEGNFVGDATQASLLTELRNGTKAAYELEFPFNPVKKWSFTALVTAYETTAPIDDKVGLSVTLKITADPTFA